MKVIASATTVAKKCRPAKNADLVVIESRSVFDGVDAAISV